jgi:3'-phosphoadenosine 5'-phosphosulfate sulfotransferase (PAPS reductase)/FAD synthetase
MLDEYKMYAKLKCHQHQIDQSMRLIDKALDKISSPYISMSFGKDSTVMAHIILSIYPHIPMLYVDCGEFDEWPDTSRVKTEFMMLFPDSTLVELKSISIWHVYQSVGFYIQDEEVSRETRNAQRAYSVSLGKTLDEEARKRGLNGSFIGMRADESNNRDRLFKMRGDLYFAKTRSMWASNPIAHLSSKDVWAYIAKNNLPYNSLYDMAPEGREMARNGAMFGTRSARYGRLALLKKAYPDLFNRFAAEFPDVRGYV